MTTSEYDELVKRLGRLADVIDNGGAVDFPDWASVREAADAITRLSRDLASAIDDGFKVELSRDALAGKLLEAQAAVASAHTAGAMLMRESAAKVAAAERGKLGNGPSETSKLMQHAAYDMARTIENGITALPLPSPVAVQAVPEGWKLHDTAPYQTWVLAWLYLSKNPIASGPVIAQRCYVEKDEPESYGDLRRMVGDWWINGRYHRAGSVTHWRDLPLPPTEAASYLLPSPAGE